MNTTTLVIGLGGTGASLIKKLYTRVSHSQRKWIRFAIINHEFPNREAMPNAIQCLKIPLIRARDFTDETITEDLTTLTNLISKNSLKPLADTTRDLCSLSYGTLPRVLFVGGLGSSTCTRMLIPLAEWLREEMGVIKPGQQKDVLIGSFLLLPKALEQSEMPESEKIFLFNNARKTIREIAIPAKSETAENCVIDSDTTNIPNTDDVADSREDEEKETIGKETKGKREDGLPFDFCFLYGSNESKEAEHDYINDIMNHAADCLYVRTIAPRSEWSDYSRNWGAHKSDDTVWERFCCAGVSRMEYPAQEILHYLTDVRMKEDLEKYWLRTEALYRDHQEEVREQKKQGIITGEKSRTEFLLDTITNAPDEERVLCGIRNQSLVKAQDGTQMVSRANRYMEVLEDYIDLRLKQVRSDSDIEQLEEKCFALKYEAEKLFKSSKDKTIGTAFADWYQQLLRYRHIVSNGAGSLGERMADDLFSGDNFLREEDKKYGLTYWMQQADGEGMIHPCSMRYFLAELVTLLEKKKNSLSSTENGDAPRKGTKQYIQRYWKEFEKKTFDDEETRDRVEKESDYYLSNHLMETNWKVLFRYKSSILSARSFLLQRFSEFYDNTEAFWYIGTAAEFYSGAARHVRMLLNAWDAFFEQVVLEYDRICDEVAVMEYAHPTVSGEEWMECSTRYICADIECLSSLSMECASVGYALDLPEQFVRAIYSKISGAAAPIVSEGHKAVLREFFATKLYATFEKAVLEKMSDRINMGLFPAILFEEMIHGRGSASDSDRKVRMAKLAESSLMHAEPVMVDRNAELPCATTVYVSDTVSEREYQTLIDTLMTQLTVITDEDLGSERFLFARACRVYRTSDFGISGSEQIMISKAIFGLDLEQVLDQMTEA